MTPDPFNAAIQRLGRAASRAAERVEQNSVLEGISGTKTLAELASKRLKGRRLILASNREPYVHFHGPQGIAWYRSAGGLTTALDAMAAACGSTWVCQGSGDGDMDVVDGADHVRVPPGRPTYTLRRLSLSAAEDKGFYEGFSNETLWPLCHVAHIRPRFDKANWEMYQAVNLKFAEAIAAEAPQGAVVFLQDYHLALVGRMLRNIRPDIYSVLFWHIPWPSSEIFRICPWKKELLDGLLGNDVLGFHLPYHAANFMETVGLELEAHLDQERMAVTRRDQRTRVRAYPISVDFEAIYAQAHTAASTKIGEALLGELGLGGLKVGLGVDRLDYTKGIPERLQAVERLFELHPEWIGRFTFLQIGVPSRSNLEDYRQVVEDIEERCKALNLRYGRPSWQPVVLRKGLHDFDQLVPIYKLADVCIVSSLHDGMNLVAKEFVAASSNDRGVLLLSRFTGAAREMEQALLVNPYDIDEMAEALHQALSMPPEEQKARLGVMRRRVAQNNIFTWAESILKDVAELVDAAALEARP